MKRLSLLLLSCLMTFSIVALSSCANRIPSMYMDVNAPQPQLGETGQYAEQSEEAEQASDDKYSSLTDNVTVTPSKSSNKTVSTSSISSPTMYSAIIPSSTPSSNPSSNPSSTPSSDTNEIPTTNSAGTEVDLEDSLYNKFVTLLSYDYNTTDSFEYTTTSKDAQMSIVVTMCENKLKTDSENNVQFFTKEDIENTYKDYFGTEISNPSALTSKSGVKYTNGRYELVNMPKQTTHTKYTRSVLSLGNGYYKIIADIRSDGSVIASATYVVKANTSSSYGANLIAQKITQY